VISISYITGISEKFKGIGERFNIKTVFKTPQGIFEKNKPQY
jgi:hypothetical protein